MEMVDDSSDGHSKWRVTLFSNSKTVLSIFWKLENFSLLNRPSIFTNIITSEWNSKRSIMKIRPEWSTGILPFQIHSNAQYLDATSDLVQKFPAKSNGVISCKGKL